MADPIIKRFLSFVSPEPNCGCWLWTGAMSPVGYGRFWMGGRTARAHRASFILFNGPIPSGMTVDHVCHDPAVCEFGTGCVHRSCVNPSHLKLATDLENMKRGHGPKRGQLASSIKRKAITHCPQGHEYTPENTYVHRSGRQCRQCRAITDERLNPRHPRPNRCPRGHEFPPDNTFIRKADDARRCRECSRLGCAHRRLKKKNAARAV